jgi:hypothetical protein
LPRIINQGIRPTTNEAMQETYEKYVRGSNPVQYFADKALEFISGRRKVVSKEEMYESYLWFCRAKKLTPGSEQSFSRKLKDLGYKDDRFRMDGKRVYCWYDVILKDWKRVEDTEQQTLTELTEEQRQQLR